MCKQVADAVVAGIIGGVVQEVSKPRRSVSRQHNRCKATKCSMVWSSLTQFHPSLRLDRSKQPGAIARLMEIIVLVSHVRTKTFLQDAIYERVRFGQRHQLVCSLT